MTKKDEQYGVLKRKSTEKYLDLKFLSYQTFSTVDHIDKKCNELLVQFFEGELYQNASIFNEDKKKLALGFLKRTHSAVYVNEEVINPQEATMIDFEVRRGSMLVDLQKTFHGVMALVEAIQYFKSFYTLETEREERLQKELEVARRARLFFPEKEYDNEFLPARAGEPPILKKDYFPQSQSIDQFNMVDEFDNFDTNEQQMIFFLKKNQKLTDWNNELTFINKTYSHLFTNKEYYQELFLDIKKKQIVKEKFDLDFYQKNMQVYVILTKSGFFSGLNSKSTNPYMNNGIKPMYAHEFADATVFRNSKEVKEILSHFNTDDSPLILEVKSNLPVAVNKIFGLPEPKAEKPAQYLAEIEKDSLLLDNKKQNQAKTIKDEVVSKITNDILKSLQDFAKKNGVDIGELLENYKTTITPSQSSKTVKIKTL